MTATRRITLTALAAGIATAGGFLIAPAAQAAPVDTLLRAYDRLVADAEDGLDVVTTATPSADSSLGILTLGTVPARSAAIVRTAFDGSGNGSQSVALRGGALLGARGTNPTNRTWATLSMMPSGFTQTAAASRGLTPATAITELDGRLITSPLAPVDLSTALVLPPNADRADTEWKRVRQSSASGGRTIITAASSDDTCAYPTIKVTVVRNRITATDWTSVCNGVRTRHVSTVTREARITGAKAPRVSEAGAFVAPSAGQSAIWSTIAAAANATAAKPMARIEQRDANGVVQRSVGSTVEGLSDLDAVMRNGNPGTVQATGTSNEGGRTLTTYRITPIAPQTSLATTPGRYQVEELTVVADDTGVIRSITSRNRVPALATPTTSTIVFTPAA